jgi:hypothetical protein
MKFKTKLKSYQRIKAKKIKWCMAHTHQSMRKLAAFRWRMQHLLKFNEVLPQGLQNLLNELSSFFYTPFIFLSHPLGFNVWFLLLLHLWTKKLSLFLYYWIRSLHNCFFQAIIKPFFLCKIEHTYKMLGLCYHHPKYPIISKSKYIFSLK